ncbi:MAG: hypothetical protein AB7F59_05430 [Bdellovibrionales bacterium]
MKTVTFFLLAFILLGHFPKVHAQQRFKRQTVICRIENETTVRSYTLRFYPGQISNNRISIAGMISCKKQMCGGKLQLLDPKIVSDHRNMVVRLSASNEVLNFVFTIPFEYLHKTLPEIPVRFNAYSIIPGNEMPETLELVCKNSLN